MAMSLTQVTEAGNSNRMEKFGFIKLLTEIKSKHLSVKQLATDRHIQIKKCLREEEKDIDHQFDVWHFAKNIKKQLSTAAKKKSCRDLHQWIRSILNHFWWACATCNEDEILLREKWTSVVFHVQNIHMWTGNENFNECAHPRLTKQQERCKEWLNPTSESFKAPQVIVFSKSILGDFKHFTKFCHTGSLEVYHSLYNKWIPKSHHFSYNGMIARNQLAAIDFNLGSNLKQAEIADGQNKFNCTFSKVTQNWSAKPIKEKKDREVFHEMIDRTLEVVA